jgi:hypothetical protein
MFLEGKWKKGKKKVGALTERPCGRICVFASDFGEIASFCCAGDQ